MSVSDLILLHPPSIFHFRELPCFQGPISDVIPSTSLFEGYPIGFLTLSEYLTRHGTSVRIVNLPLKMLRDRTFDAERFTASLSARAFGIDLHWLPHVDGCLTLGEHRRAMLMPSWKQRLNYETDWMSRDDIVNATYAGAEALVDLKRLHGLIPAEAARQIKEHISRARTVIELLDRGGPVDQELASEIHRLNRLDSLCGKHELDWHVIGKRYHLFRCITALFSGRPLRLGGVAPPLTGNTSPAVL